MKWVKKGLIFNTDNNYQWMQTHAQIPVICKLNDTVSRIYFSTRDIQGRALPTYIEVDKNDLSKILYVHDRPLLNFGEIGTFDDNGIMVSSIVDSGDKVLMYYIGWNPQVTVSYRLSIGLAISYDGGVTFKKISNGPLLDRSLKEPYFNTAPCVIYDINKWKMWYVSCTGWKVINGRTEPVYLVRYAESEDGISWNKIDKPCLDYAFDGEALGRPWVIKKDNLYEMWYSQRGSMDYRNGSGQHYTIKYAVSKNGLDWERKDGVGGICVSNEGWDSEMIEYCCVYYENNSKIMLYNGNGFGKSGFGYAVLEQ